MPYALTMRVGARTRRQLLGTGVTLREEPDGSAVIRIDTESSGASVSLALSLGADVEVLDPPEAREAVATAAHAIAATYDR